MKNFRWTRPNKRRFDLVAKRGAFKARLNYINIKDSNTPPHWQVSASYEVKSDTICYGYYSFLDNLPLLLTVEEAKRKAQEFYDTMRYRASVEYEVYL